MEKVCKFVINLNKIKKMTNQEMQDLGEKIVSVLQTIYDPEIPVDIYELGLIYDVQVSENRDAIIVMTLTTPNCPVAESLPIEVQEKVKTIEEINEVKVDLTFEPAWDQDMMSEVAKLELGML